MLASLLVALIRVYQVTLSKVILALAGPVCRFQPSCSRYAIACIQGHGALRGSLLSVKRLCRCHPLHPGGYDPPPPPRNGAASGPKPASRTSAAGDDGTSVTTPRAAAPAPRPSAHRTSRPPFTSVAAATPAIDSATISATARLAPEGAGR